MIAPFVAALLLSHPREAAFTVDERIVYRTVGKQKLMLDLYRPALITGKVPIVIAIHGGSWISGNRTDMAPLCEALVKQGMAVATVDYRLAPKTKWPGMLDDCEYAYTYLVKNASALQIDPTRLGTTGVSAGGHIALLMADKPVSADDIKAGVPSHLGVRAVLNLFGPTDLVHDFPADLSNFVSMQVVGKPAAEAMDDAAQMSPVNFVTPGSAAVFTIHGLADTLVPIKQAERLNDALQASQVDHQLREIPGMQHEYAYKNPAFILALQDGVSFMASHLGAQRTSP